MKRDHSAFFVRTLMLYIYNICVCACFFWGAPAWCCRNPSPRSRSSARACAPGWCCTCRRPLQGAPASSPPLGHGLASKCAKHSQCGTPSFAPTGPPRGRQMEDLNIPNGKHTWMFFENYNDKVPSFPTTSPSMLKPPQGTENPRPVLLLKPTNSLLQYLQPPPHVHRKTPQGSCSSPSAAPDPRWQHKEPRRTSKRRCWWLPPSRPPRVPGPKRPANSPRPPDRTQQAGRCFCWHGSKTGVPK